MKKGNDIDESQVLEQLERKKHDSNKPEIEGHRDFRDMLLISNAKEEHRPILKPVTDNELGKNDLERLMTMMERGGFDSSSEEKSQETISAREPVPLKEIKVRKEFPETWIFDSFNLNSK
jgi:hypothetical protein